MTLQTPAAQGIHAADCSIWDVPGDAAPEVLIGEGIEREDVVAYLGQVRPIYDALNRVLGQFAGLILLSQTGARGTVDLDRPIFTVARDQLVEAAGRLAAVPTTAIVSRHHAAMEEVAGLLKAGLQALEHEMGSPRRSEAALDPTITLLFRAQKALLRAAEPRAGMTPVDFSHACCSCGVARSPAPAKD